MAQAIKKSLPHPWYCIGSWAAFSWVSYCLGIWPTSRQRMPSAQQIPVDKDRSPQLTQRMECAPFVEVMGLERSFECYKPNNWLQHFPTTQTVLTSLWEPSGPPSWVYIVITIRKLGKSLNFRIKGTLNISYSNTIFFIVKLLMTVSNLCNTLIVTKFSLHPYEDLKSPFLKFLPIVCSLTSIWKLTSFYARVCVMCWG